MPLFNNFTINPNDDSVNDPTMPEMGSHAILDPGAKSGHTFYGFAPKMKAKPKMSMPGDTPNSMPNMSQTDSFENA
jgi:hypothetical protein